MQIKRFYGKTVHAAMEKAKAELGPEAVLLHARTVKSKLGGGSMVEIIVAVDREAPSAVDELKSSELSKAREIAGSRAAIAAYSKAGESEERFELRHIGEELAEIRDLLHILLSDVKREKASHLPETVRGFYDRFVEGELDPGIAYDLAVGLEACFAEGSERTVHEQLVRMLSKLVRVSGGITLEGGPKFVALVGPTGVGKTTTIAKLAAHFKLRLKRRVAFLSIDSYRIGATYQLNTYAEIMKIPFRLAQDPSELREKADELSDHDLILIDTPGRSQRDLKRIKEIESFLLELPQVEVHLLISAVTRDRDVRDIIDAFLPLGVDYLIFTKLDESSCFGALVNAAVRSERPISYFTTGQDAAGDIEVATVERIASLLLRGFKR